MKKRLLALTGMAVCSLGLTACGNGEDLGEAMGRAGLNTLIGMGTVFIVLILISLIIEGFAVIPKLQKAFAGKKEDRNSRDEGQAVSQEPAAAQVQEPEETDDLELVAVIAAAIAASEGAASTDGFVVRSIIRRA